MSRVPPGFSLPANAWARVVMSRQATSAVRFVTGHGLESQCRNPMTSRRQFKQTPAAVVIDPRGWVRHQVAYLYRWGWRGTSSATPEHRFVPAFALPPVEHKRPNKRQPIPNNLPARVVFTEETSVFLGGVEGSRKFLRAPPHRRRRGHLFS